MLTCFIDDSGSGLDGPVFLLAGYVSTVQRWEEFSDKWQALLDDPLGNGKYRLQYFKMSQAFRLQDQFKDWKEEERDEAILKFAYVIKSEAMFSVRAVLWMPEFNAIKAKYPMYAVEPYALLFPCIMTSTIKHVRTLPVKEKVDFIFDVQGPAGPRAVEMFRLAQRMIPAEMLEYVAGLPSHKSELEFLPLQAADFIAWQSRRFCADNMQHGTNRKAYLMRPQLRYLDEILTISTNLHRDAIKDFFQTMKKRFPDGVSAKDLGLE